MFAGKRRRASECDRWPVLSRARVTAVQHRPVKSR